MTDGWRGVLAADLGPSPTTAGDIVLLAFVGLLFVFVFGSGVYFARKKGSARRRPEAEQAAELAANFNGRDPVDIPVKGRFALPLAQIRLIAEQCGYVYEDKLWTSDALRTAYHVWRFRRARW